MPHRACITAAVSLLFSPVNASTLAERQLIVVEVFDTLFEALLQHPAGQGDEATPLDVLLHEQ